MAKGLLDLATSLEKKAKAIDEAASKLAVDTALTIVGDLAYKTPVDTSQALSNWQVSLGSPVDSKIPPYYPGEGGSTRNSSAQSTIDAAKNALKQKRPGVTIYISNVLPYIRRLNDGYSKQAPAGFVERAVLIGRKMRKNFKIKG
jgi:hypothetical protein